MVPPHTIVTLAFTTLHSINLESAYVTLYILEMTAQSTLEADVIPFAEDAPDSRTLTALIA